MSKNVYRTKNEYIIMCLYCISVQQKCYTHKISIYFTKKKTHKLRRKKLNCKRVNNPTYANFGYLPFFGSSNWTNLNLTSWCPFVLYIPCMWTSMRSGKFIDFWSTWNEMEWNYMDALKHIHWARKVQFWRTFSKMYRDGIYIKRMMRWQLFPVFLNTL